MKKLISVLVVLVMVTMVMLTGCGKQGTAQTPAPADKTNKEQGQNPAGEIVSPVKIRVAWWGDTKRHELYNKILDEFEAANEGITTVREPMGWGDYWDKLTVQSASGGAPDFMGMHPQYANDYLRRGVIEPLDSYIDEGIIDISKMSKGAVNSGVVDGITYMIPMGLTAQSFFIDGTFLNEIGLDLPSFDWTWDDLKSLGLEARAKLDAEGKDNVWLVDENSFNFQMFRHWVRQRGRELYTTDGQVGFTAEDVADWFSYWKELRENGIVPDAATSIEYKKATLENSLFVQGKIAIRGVPANQYKLYCEALPDNDIEIVRNPSMADGGVGEYVEGAHFAISADTTDDKKVAAAKLIHFWVNTEESMQLFGMDQGVPANNEMAEFIKPTLDDIQLKSMEYVGKIAELAGQAPPTVYPPAGASEIDALFQSGAEEVMFDVKAPAESAENIVNEAKAIIDRNNQ